MESILIPSYSLANTMAWVISLGSVFGITSGLHAEAIDVYFILGQSNAGNIAEQNQLNETGKNTGVADVGFTLDFARIEDRSTGVNGSSAPSNTVDAYRTNLLDTGRAVNRLAVGLHQGNDIGIYGFARNGRPLSNVANTQDGGESWSASAGELYPEFVAWGQQRLADLSAASFQPTLKGLFWFQGEGDVVLVRNGTDPDAANDYQANFEDLLLQMNDDFSQHIDRGLAVVAADLRMVNTTTNQESLNQQVRDSLANVAAADPWVGVVATTDGNGNALANRFNGSSGYNTDVHFSDNAQEMIVDRWVAESLRIQVTNVPEPGSFILTLAGLTGLAMRRPRRQ